MKVETISVDQIVPNPLNANRMTNDEFAQLVVEVRRLGRPPQRSKVRPRSDGKYELIGGEHNWRAAIEAGHTHIECEIHDVDDAEALRMMLADNKRGRNHPVLEGRVYKERLRLTGLSIRQLAAPEDEPSEATVRNRILYADAYELRKRYADRMRLLAKDTGLTSESPDPLDEIGALSVEHVRKFMDLPNEVRNVWLDAGGDIREVKGKETLIENVIAKKLHCLLSSRPGRFADSLRLAKRFLEWQLRRSEIKGIDAYVLAAAKRRASIRVLDELPVDHSTQPPRILVAIEDWTKVINAVTGLPELTDSEICDAIAGRLHKYLSNAGVDPESIYDADRARMEQVISQASDFVRQSERLSRKEKYHLANRRNVEALPDDLLIEAQRCTCEYFERTREAGEEPEEHIGIVFSRKIDELQQERVAAQYLANSCAARQSIIQTLRGTLAISSGVVGDRSATDVLTERLDEVPRPELIMLAMALDQGIAESAALAWLRSLGGAVPSDDCSEPAAPRRSIISLKRIRQRARDKFAEMLPGSTDRERDRRSALDAIGGTRNDEFSDRQTPIQKRSRG